MQEEQGRFESLSGALCLNGLLRGIRVSFGSE